MNKFIALAFFALCATLAHGQIISTLPLGLYSGDSSSSSSAAAAAAASSSAANSGLSRIAGGQLVSPLAQLPLNYPYGAYGPYGPVVAPGWGPYGPVAPVPGVIQYV